MEKNNKIGLIYGYAVCLVSVIVFLIFMSTLVNAVFDLSDPMHAQVYSGRDDPSLASFDIYKMEVLGSLSEGQQAPEDQTLQAMYDAARDDRIQTVRSRSIRTITASILSILVSVILFTVHWMWMRRMGKSAA